MVHFFRLLSCLLLTGLLISCASTERRSGEDALDDVSSSTLPASYKYHAWRPDTSGELEAISVLLMESDNLIDDGAYDAASDKLERALRIQPNCASAWSRLSWLALQTNSPDRAVQMAKRSNSFSYSNSKLQSLNWSFIRKASKKLHDEALFARASQKIESLQ